MDGSSSTSQREKLLEGSDMDLKGARWGEGGGGEGCENKKRREREWVEGEGEKGKRRGQGNEGSTRRPSTPPNEKLWFQDSC